MNSASTFPGRKRLTYTAVIVAAFWVGLSQSAWAAIISRDVNVTLNATNVETYDLDVDLDGITDFTFTAALVLDPVLSVGFDTVDFRFGSNNAVVVDATGSDGFPSASRLQLGSTVSAANTFSGPNDQGNLFFFTTFDAPSGNFGGNTGYLGFRFDTAVGTNFGFAQVTVNALNALDNPLGLTIGRVAYNNTPGQSIQIAAVPEPSAFALCVLALLAVFVQVKRRGCF